MNKSNDKLGWKKAAAWVGGLVYAGWAAHDVYTRGWNGAVEVAAVTGALIWASACLHVANQYFNPKRSSSNKDCTPS